MVTAYSSSRQHLIEGDAPHRTPTAPLTAIGPNKTGVSDFSCFEQGLPAPVRFMWQQSALQQAQLIHDDMCHQQSMFIPAGN
jgi:hypothetical protein